MKQYLERLQHRLQQEIQPSSELWIMGSAGTLLSPEEAMASPVLTCLSGPAGGLRGAWGYRSETPQDTLLTHDMGGTSTDVSIVNAHLHPEDESAIDQWPLRVPVLLIDTVGAGGGSIAYVDDGGALRVGPESSGAVHPACYGRGGTRPTVTDANLLLGRINLIQMPISDWTPTRRTPR